VQLYFLRFFADGFLAAGFFVGFLAADFFLPLGFFLPAGFLPAGLCGGFSGGGGPGFKIIGCVTLNRTE
jgi:hypothetical protein